MTATNEVRLIRTITFWVPDAAIAVEQDTEGFHARWRPHVFGAWRPVSNVLVQQAPPSDAPLGETATFNLQVTLSEGADPGRVADALHDYLCEMPRYDVPGIEAVDMVEVTA